MVKDTPHQSFILQHRPFLNSFRQQVTHDRCFRAWDHWKRPSFAERKTPDRPRKSLATFFDWTYDCCMWWCSCNVTIKYDRCLSFSRSRKQLKTLSYTVTPLDVVKTRLQSQEISGIRHLDGTLVMTCTVNKGILGLIRVYRMVLQRLFVMKVQQHFFEDYQQDWSCQCLLQWPTLWDMTIFVIASNNLGTTTPCFIIIHHFGQAVLQEVCTFKSTRCQSLTWWLL